MNPINVSPNPPDLPPIPDEFPRARQTRITLITKLYHQLPEYNPTGPETAPYTDLMENEEQPYQRRIKIGEQWVPVDFGWTAGTGCAFLHIVNEYSVRRRTVPTPEMRQEDLLHVLEIGKVIKGVTPPEGQTEYVEPLYALYVGQPATISPLNQERYRIRCRTGEGQYSVFCVPADPF